MHVTSIHAGNPGPMTGPGNNTYLVGFPEAVLIDAGVGEPAHLDAVDVALGRHRARLAAVVVTHGHPDHVSGVAAIARRWPGLRCLKVPWEPGDSRWPVPWTALVPGGSVAVGEDGVLTVVATPGHAPDHVALWHAASRTAFVGDLVMRDGTVMIPASRGGDLRAYLDSLRRLRALDPVRLLPAHGPAIEDPIAVLERTLRHRQLRERQIVTAVGEGCSRIESIVETVYHGLDARLSHAARESVLAHLVKLEEEGRVIREPGDRWRLAGSETHAADRPV